jgi:hypothetical protein
MEKYPTESQDSRRVVVLLMMMMMMMMKRVTNQPTLRKIPEHGRI